MRLTGSVISAVIPVLYLDIRDGLEEDTSSVAVLGRSLVVRILGVVDDLGIGLVGKSSFRSCDEAVRVLECSRTVLPELIDSAVTEFPLLVFSGALLLSAGAVFKSSNLCSALKSFEDKAILSEL